MTPMRLIIQQSAFGTLGIVVQILADHQLSPFVGFGHLTRASTLQVHSTRPEQLYQTAALCTIQKAWATATVITTVPSIQKFVDMTLEIVVQQVVKLRTGAKFMTAG